MTKLTKAQKEVLIRMRKGNFNVIYIGMLGVEGLSRFGMSIVNKVRRGTANALVREKFAEKVPDGVRLTELGKTCIL